MAEWPRECEQCGRGIRQVYRGRPRKYCRSCAYDIQQQQIAEHKFARKEADVEDAQMNEVSTRSQLNYSELKRKGLVK